MANSESTKNKILRVSSTMFLEVGYSKTSPQMIAKELGISTGNLTYYYPTKEHLLAVLTDLLCKYQWKMIKEEADDGISSLLALCFELMTMASACEESEVAKDFFVSTYQSPKCLEIIHNNDTARAKEVFAEYCPDWTDEQFREAEILVAGIEHATLNAIDKTVPLEIRISGALNTIMTIYNVPEEIRRIKIEKVLAMDYRSIGKRIFNEFKEYVEGMQNSE
ncbi:MAG: TetR/AcrR family transcriptional regulator [Clostridia bacterium]|nr:TetR/AcrR family transcriptional regulator [Clostridia bacterium]